MESTTEYQYNLGDRVKVKGTCESGEIAELLPPEEDGIPKYRVLFGSKVKGNVSVNIQATLAET
jgi:hypothetical protein